MKKFSLTLSLICLLYIGVSAQTSKILDNAIVSTTTVKLLGKSGKISDLTKKAGFSKEKKAKFKKDRKRPDNFKARRSESKAYYLDKEFQGADPIRQKGFAASKRQVAVEPLVNIDGLGQGSPLDPTGDIGMTQYLQSINGTFVGVYGLDGTLIDQFSMNTLWTEFGVSGQGDPIILYDEQVDRWVLTEFTDPANMLVAISATGDALGEYTAYNFATPNFPDYPKFALTPRTLMVTTNEAGGGALHQYFIDKAALYAGEDDVTMQRIELEGNTGTEAGFYVTTPVDWNGANAQFDDKAYALRINDSSWAGGPDEDQIEIYSFDIDFENQANTVIVNTSVVTTPFDSYPCSAEGFGFACIPQQSGGGLDGIPEVIMNLPHLRNFETHESMVFSFITDVTNGENLAGIRWVELRRTDADSEWELYQEGTFAPEDGKDRWMSSIAIDDNGNIGMGYNVSSSEDFAGVRFTGRFSTDPLGTMTVDEYEVVAGQGTINSGGRFGDYSQISVSPDGSNTFWFTTEYAGTSNFVTQSRILAFQLSKDSFDLATTNILSPGSGGGLTATERVTAEFTNTGVNPIDNYTVSLLVDGVAVETIAGTSVLTEGESTEVQFVTEIDMTTFGNYSIGAAIATELDLNSANDTLSVIVTSLPPVELGLGLMTETSVCADVVDGTVTINNLGSEVINNVVVSVSANDGTATEFTFDGSINAGDSADLAITINEGVVVGENSIVVNLVSVNGEDSDSNPADNSATATSTSLGADSFMTVVLNTDRFAEETAWSVIDQENNLVVATSAGGYEDETEYRQIICASSDKCYTLVVTDVYGDGICCAYGNGNISVENASGEVVYFNNGEYGDGFTANFCLVVVDCDLSATFDIIDATAGDSGDGNIVINATGGSAPYSYSIDGGLSSQDQPTFINVGAGDYDVIISDATDDCTYAETITVGVQTSVVDVNGALVELKVIPNPTDGLFSVDLSNLNIAENFLTIQIIDMAGKLVQERMIAKYDDNYVGTFSLYDYADGTYFVRIKHPTVQIIERVIKL